MAFQLDARHIETIVDYGDAVAQYQATKPWRGEEEVGMWRCLDTANNRKRHTAFRLNTSNGDVECRLHSTNVVTYHENGDITILPYQSVSTDNFASALLPSDFYPWMTRENGGCIGVSHPDVPRSSSWYGEGKRYYQLYTKANHDDRRYAYHGYRDRNSGLRFKKVDGYYVPAQEPLPFDRYTLDRKKTRAALKEHDYADFAAFARGVATIGQGRLDTEGAGYGFDAGTLVQLIADRNRWMDILRAYHRKWGGQRFTADGLLERVRLAIYHGAGVVEVEEVPYVDSYSAIKSLDSAERKYQYL